MWITSDVGQHVVGRIVFVVRQHTHEGASGNHILRRHGTWHMARDVGTRDMQHSESRDACHMSHACSTGTMHTSACTCRMHKLPTTNQARTCTCTCTCPLCIARTCMPIHMPRTCTLCLMYAASSFSLYLDMTTSMVSGVGMGHRSIRHVHVDPPPSVYASVPCRVMCVAVSVVCDGAMDVKREVRRSSARKRTRRKMANSMCGSFSMVRVWRVWGGSECVGIGVRAWEGKRDNMHY